jgi:hypothetical protein
MSIAKHSMSTRIGMTMAVSTRLEPSRSAIEGRVNELQPGIYKQNAPEKMLGRRRSSTKSYVDNAGKEFSYLAPFQNGSSRVKYRSCARAFS